MLFNLKSITLIVLSICQLGLSQEVEPCTGDIKTRKNIKDLNEYQLKAYFDSVKALNNGPKPTIYDSFAEIHLKFAKDIHNTPLFLIWHRYFLYFMEKELQKIDPSVVIPYWDWTENNERAHEDMVFSDSYFGGRSGSDRCVIDGQFKDFKGYYRANGNNQEHCLQRKVNFTLSSTSRYVLNTNYFSLTTIDKFCNDLEYVPHGTVHSAIGGEFGTHASPNDPIFWSHHAFIDKLFYVWQKRNPSQANFYHLPLDTFVVPWSATIEQGLNSDNSLCVSYNEDSFDLEITGNINRNEKIEIKPYVKPKNQTLSNSELDEFDAKYVFDGLIVEDRSSNSTDLMKEAASKLISREYLKMFNIPIEKVRELEKRDTITDYLHRYTP